MSAGGTCYKKYGIQALYTSLHFLPILLENLFFVFLCLLHVLSFGFEVIFIKFTKFLTNQVLLVSLYKNYLQKQISYINTSFEFIFKRSHKKSHLWKKICFHKIKVFKKTFSKNIQKIWQVLYTTALFWTFRIIKQKILQF